MLQLQKAVAGSKWLRLEVLGVVEEEEEGHFEGCIVEKMKGPMKPGAGAAGFETAEKEKPSAHGKESPGAEILKEEEEKELGNDPGGSQKCCSEACWGSKGQVLIEVA